MRWRELPLIAFALTLAVLIGGGVLGYHNVRRMVSNERLVAHTDNAIVDLEAAYSGVRGAEAGQRSYLLTGDSGYLQPYQAAVGETQYELMRLQYELKGVPAQQQRLLALKETIGRQLADLNRAIAMSRVGDRAGALVMVAGDQWKGHTDRVRAQVTAIQTAEYALLDRRAAQSERSYRRTVSSLLAAAMIGVALLAVVFYLGRRNLALQRRATTRIRSIVDNVVDGIVTTDAHGTIGSVNPAAERLFGYEAAELIGQNVNVLMREPYRSGHDDYFAEYRRSGEAKVIGIGREVEGRRRDGSTFALELAVNEFELGAQPYFTAILRDVTERKRLEQQNHEMMNALKESDRHKDEFLALLAHELRGPLAPLRNCLELLKLGGSDQNLRDKVQGTMERQLAQMVRLVNDLLDLGRVSCGQIEVRREPVELGSVMRHAADACAPLVTAASHVLSTVVPPESVYVDADPARLAQVFGNLLQNVCKYAEPGGRIDFSASRQAGQAVVRVKDTGIGIPPGKLESIFGLFVQVSRTSERAQGGLGIGLALVKRLVELHGGSIEACSAGPGTGSEFIVRLPLRPHLLVSADVLLDAIVPAPPRAGCG
ncbi:MAG: PAS domain S-box protein [Steroidobacteraceae bacterium]